MRGRALAAFMTAALVTSACLNQLYHLLIHKRLKAKR